MDRRRFLQLSLLVAPAVALAPQVLPLPKADPTIHPAVPRGVYKTNLSEPILSFENPPIVIAEWDGSAERFFKKQYSAQIDTAEEALMEQINDNIFNSNPFMARLQR